MKLPIRPPKLTSMELDVRLQGTLRPKLFAALVAGMRLRE